MSCQIKLENISFNYGTTPIIKDLSTCIEKGSFLSIIGPNGSGKSTLLKVVTAINKPLIGKVLLDNKSVSAMSRREIAQKVAVVPQNTSMEFDFKVIDVVLMGRYPFIKRFSSESQADLDIAIEYMKYTNTLHLSERNFMELSGGERQRVILAQALTQQPEILVLDEPISHLDLQHQVEILNLIRKLCVDNKLTVIAVLHDLNMASTYSDKIIMLKDGQIYSHGEPFEVLTARNIKEVFHTDVYVSVGAIGNKPYIYTLTKPHIEKNNIRVHVICGGGSGSGIIKELYISGYDVTSGILTIGDQDWKTAMECELDIAEEIPFVDTSDAAYSMNMKLIYTADYIILTGLYFGKANIKNLEILLEEKHLDKKLLILEDASFKDRDYTDGYAAELYEQLKKRPNVRLIDIRELQSELNGQEKV